MNGGVQVGALVVTVCATGCAVGSGSPTHPGTLEPAHPRSSQEPPLSPWDRGNPIGPSNEAPAMPDAGWLGDGLTAEYRELPASVALREVTQGRPVRMDVGGADPLVDSPSGAASIGEHVASICRQADWFCTVDDSTVMVTDIETRMFPLSVQPGSVSSSMRLRALAGGEAASANQVNLVLQPYEDEVVGLVQTAAGIGPAAGGAGAPTDPRTSVTVLPSASAAVVTARPHVMRRVAREIQRYNRSVSRTVRLHVAMYEVEATGTNDRGIDLVVLRDSAHRFGLRVVPATTGAVGTVAELSVERGNAGHGGRAVLRWLRTLGRTTVSLDDVVEVRNNAVATVDATETRQFVSQVSRQTEIAGLSQLATPQVEFDELRLGFSLALQPTVVEDAVTVRIALSRRDLVEERPYSLGGGAVQGTTYTTDDLNRVMSVALRSGETKLLTGLANSVRTERTRRLPWLPWIGDSVSKRRSKREVVLLLSAEIR